MLSQRIETLPGTWTADLSSVCPYPESDLYSIRYRRDNPQKIRKISNKSQKHIINIRKRTKNRIDNKREKIEKEQSLVLDKKVSTC